MKIRWNKPTICDYCRSKCLQDDGWEELGQFGCYRIECEKCGYIMYHENGGRRLKDETP